MTAKSGKVKCVICNTFHNYSGSSNLVKHLRNDHTITPTTYLTKYLKIKNECLICSKPTKLKNTVLGFSKYCSQRCVNFGVHENFPEKRNSFISRAKISGPKNMTNYNKSAKGRQKSREVALNNWATRPDMVAKLLRAAKTTGADNLRKFNSDPRNALNRTFGCRGKVAEYNKTGIIMRSNIERDFATLLDAYKIKWKYEPKSFLVNIEGRTYYTPDFLIKSKLSGKLYLIEVKMRKHQTPIYKEIAKVLKSRFKLRLIIVSPEKFTKLITNFI